MAGDNAKNAEFIGRVVTDAKNPPSTRLLTGWLGDAGEEGYRRLYTDAELNSYVDVPEEAILYTEPMRDSQPAGGVLVWVKRDAALNQGGSAFSRAARFLQGEVQQDFASGALGSLEKAGLRCTTQEPCGEVTGFTGKCTNEPQVGGAWPCITAPPHCARPTGFTGQCTQDPWPNPTLYRGCTVYHCPTRDLTHIPHICNIVASGMPGCGGFAPPVKGDDPAAKAGVNEGAAAEPPPTALPGCGYTKTWGLCETRLLGCQKRDIGPQVSVGIICTQFECGTQPPTELCTPVTCPPTKQPDSCPQTQFDPNCPSVGITCTQFDPQCPTKCGPHCQTPQLDCTQFGELCNTKLEPCTQYANCKTNPLIDCTFGCTHFGTGCTNSPQCVEPVTVVAICTLIPNRPGLAAAVPPFPQTAGPANCTQFGVQCPTQPNGDCTFFGGCLTQGQAAAAGPGTGCTQSGPQCAPTPATACTQYGAPCPTQPSGDCTFFGGCPTRTKECVLTAAGCPPTSTTECTQFGPQCPTQPNGDCTFFGGCNTQAQCPQAGFAARLGGGGRQFTALPRCLHTQGLCAFDQTQHFQAPTVYCVPTPACVPTDFCPPTVLCQTHLCPPPFPTQVGCTRFPCNSFTFWWRACTRPE